MQLDVRGPRFAAMVTTVVLIVIALTRSGWLAAAQAVVFAVGALSARHAPYGVLFRVLVAPRLGPPREVEPAEPVRFAQAVGFVFATVAALGFLTGATAVGLVATAFALIAAFLNAAFGLCLGCEAYLLLRRLGPARRA
ncbi:DUF4395 domain-containing protein [Hamadaea sp. NPDC050747]|uniref:DUF4395 domain-containing protein n=1 Tax=Hamadaea sp. NPDC050747 TaxID=3155789 RepID=UPI0033D51BB7